MSKEKTYVVNLSEAERKHLQNIISSGTEKARKLTRARILLKVDAGWLDKDIQEALDVSSSMVEKTRKRYFLEGFDLALNGHKPGKAPERKLDGKAEAHLIALTCSPPPTGYARWTLRLLADRLVRLEQVEVEMISHETVRQTLKKMNLSLGKTRAG